MKILLIYDSFFGNTEKIAQAIATVLETPAVPVSQVSLEQLSGLDLLVVGSPTRGFRPSEGITQWLEGLPHNQLSGIQAAAFDTRILLESIKGKAFRFMVDKGGYAASKIAKALARKGAQLIAPPEGFIVKDTEGPLMEGELEHAAAWAEKLSTLAGDKTG